MNAAAIGLVTRTLGYKHSGRLRSPRDRVGQTFRNADGHEFVIFRETVLDSLPDAPRKPEAMFRVQFQVSKIVPWRDRLVIAMKSPIFVGLPGFRSKLWMVDEKNSTYQGVYEWDRLQDAENYVRSASMDFMANVAVPGGLSYEIVPGGAIARSDSALEIQVPAGPRA
jgi:hypothetical protein